MGGWIPVSTLPNVHPPGVMAYLAGWWSIFGFSIAATRVAMLMVAALGVLFTFLLGVELSGGATGAPAFGAAVLLCISPLFFAQSMLAQLDMPAMCLSILALLLFLKNRFVACSLVCTGLVLVKETGLVVPALFGCWLLFEHGRRKEALSFLLPLPGLLIWLGALQHATGHWFGNAEFTSYNVWEPLHPVHFAYALARRVYYLFISSGHFIGTIALVWAFRRMPIFRQRPWRIAASFVLAQVLMVSVLGGAVLERYLLPALPVVYIAFALSLQALVPRTRQLTFAALAVCLVATNFVNPIYPFPFENNLAFIGFVELQKSVAASLERREGVVASVFPMAAALRNPDLGFVQRSRNVIAMADFSPSEVEKLKVAAPAMVVVFTRTWDPLHLTDIPFVRRYGYVPEMDADEIASALTMHVDRRWTKRGLSFELLTR